MDINTLLIAKLVDNTNLLLWLNTKDAKNNTNRPKSVVESLLEREEQNEIETFDSGEAFEAARKRILEEIQNG